jgi:hypothetical protein
MWILDNKHTPEQLTRIFLDRLAFAPKIRHVVIYLGAELPQHMIERAQYLMGKLAYSEVFESLTINEMPHNK